MRAILVGSLVIGVLFVSNVGSAVAGGATPNGNNCTGVFASGVAGPIFGRIVRELARAGGADDFYRSLANCP